MSGLTRGRVSIGVVSAAKYFAPRAIAAFAASHPRIDIKLTEGNRGAIIGALERLDLDVAIMGTPPDKLAVSQQAIGDHPFVIIAPARHLLAGRRRRVELATLANENFLMREPGSGTRTLMERLFVEHKLAPRTGAEFGSNETIKQAVMAGMGIAGISQHTIGLEVGLGLLKILPVEGWPLMRRWFVVHRRGMPLMPLHERLRDFFSSEGPGIIAELERSYSSLAAISAAPRHRRK
jgi:DNA-binding transcriptional LysR family regulator